jgi:hypothetical protein
MKGSINGFTFNIIGRYDRSIEVRVVFPVDTSKAIENSSAEDFILKLASELADFAENLSWAPMLATHLIEKG